MTERLQAIYEPKGKAAEYAAYACNLYRGCTHGCTYCYAPQVLKRPVTGYSRTSLPEPTTLPSPTNRNNWGASLQLPLYSSLKRR